MCAFMGKSVGVRFFNGPIRVVTRGYVRELIDEPMCYPNIVASSNPDRYHLCCRMGRPGESPNYRFFSIRRDRIYDRKILAVTDGTVAILDPTIQSIRARTRQTIVFRLIGNPVRIR